jgi:hypothetical protein
VLLVLDQFEQWLHAKGQEENPELVQALRQCDGGRVQALVLVRDDFGMAATRFMAALDFPILQGQNFATVDLFGPSHAKKVLAEFGRAFGSLPQDLGTLTREQNTFVEQAVAGLAQDGRIISVRLVLQRRLLFLTSRRPQFGEPPLAMTFRGPAVAFAPPLRPLQDFVVVPHAHLQ